MVKPKLLIFELSLGMGISFGLCPRKGQIIGRLKMVYRNGAYDAKACGAINCF